MKMILFIGLLWSTGAVCSLHDENIVIVNNDNNNENTGDKSPVRPPIPPIPPIPPTTIPPAMG